MVPFHTLASASVMIVAAYEAFVAVRTTAVARARVVLVRTPGIIVVPFIAVLSLSAVVSHETRVDSRDCVIDCVIDCVMAGVVFMAVGVMVRLLVCRTACGRSGITILGCWMLILDGRGICGKCAFGAATVIKIPGNRGGGNESKTEIL